MSVKMIEYCGIVQWVEDGQVIVVMEIVGCSFCGQGSSCGIGKMVSGCLVILLMLLVSGDIKVGDLVSIGLLESCLMLLVLFGYFFFVFVMFFGVWFGFVFDGSDGVMVFGVIVGFFGVFVIVCFVIGLIFGLLLVL